MSSANDLERIICIKEDVKLVNKLSRKIYMLALNAMLLSRRAGSAATGYARVTKELRSFSEKLENSMQHLTNLSAGMADTVSASVKRKRIVSLYNQAIKLAKQRSTCSSGFFEKSSSINLDVNNSSFNEVAQHLLRLQQLCRQGHSVAMLAKVEAMHVGSNSAILHGIGEEVSTFVEEVEAAMMVAFSCAKFERAAA